MGKLMINGEQYPAIVVKAGLDDTQTRKDATWSSDKINEELEDVRSELDIIVEEANKNTTINDEATSLTTTWSSKKTSDELGKKSNTINISMVGLGFTKGAEVPLEDFMIAISEKMSNNYSTIYKVNWTDENSAYVVFGNKKVNINGGVLYCSQSNTITNTWTDLTILYTPNISSPNLYKFTARKDGSTLNVYMFEYPYVADTTSSITSTYSSAKIDEKINDTAKLAYFSRTANRGYLKITNADDGRPVSISDICGGKIEIYGNGRVVASDNNYFAKVLRLSYGNWTTFDATKDTVTYKKIFKTYLDETNKTFYVEVGSNTRFCVEGAKTVEMLELDDVDIAQFTEIPESQFASKSDLATKLDKGYMGITDANNAIGENGVNIFVMSASSANMPLSRTGVIRSFSYVQDNYIRVNQEFSTIDNSPQNGGTYKRYGSSDDGGATFTWSNWNFVASIDDSSTASLKTWSSSKIASTIDNKFLVGTSAPTADTCPVGCFYGVYEE